MSNWLFQTIPVEVFFRVPTLRHNSVQLFTTLHIHESSYICFALIFSFMVSVNKAFNGRLHMLQPDELEFRFSINNIKGVNVNLILLVDVSNIFLQFFLCNLHI